MAHLAPYHVHARTDHARSTLDIPISEREASVQFSDRRRQWAGKQIDNSSLQAGSPMVWYCVRCGALSDTEWVPPPYPQTVCDDCVEITNQHQANRYIHPLTCGVDSRHENLEARQVGDTVLLFCPDCVYIQKWIPGVVMGMLDQHDELMARTERAIYKK